MPELPEVETITRKIRPDLEGREILGSRVSWTRTLGGYSRPRFERAIAGARAVRVWRRGKFIVVDLERDRRSGGGPAPAGALVIHLRMTGRLHVGPPEDEIDPYVRVALDLDDGRELRFVDVRKFGRFRFTTRPEELFAPLGPEPLGEEFTADWLAAALKRRRRMLKPLLLDQTFVAGLGNIYVDESLFRARIHPLTRSDSLTRRRVDVLHGEIRATLAEAIEREGSSFDSFYRTPEGRPGSYQHLFRVYGRDGQPCRRCGRMLVKITVGQRGTHLCRGCQRAPRRRRILPP
ncbi:MAG: DNA-formamidopyrimidine glycosylase [Planctomycetota bacterium]|nr:DNA-formamidopyrimidine glycosylase [Planctomycetota bacterium]